MTTLPLAKKLDCARDCFAKRDYDKLHGKGDHFPVVADFQGRVTGKAKTGTTVQYDPAALRDKELARKFGDLLDGKPMPSWGTNITYHFDETVDNIKDAAKQCFTKNGHHTYATPF